MGTRDDLDTFDVAPEGIRDIKVVATLVGGRVVHGALPRRVLRFASAARSL